jgi:DNA mismatch repair protein MSH5
MRTTWWWSRLEFGRDFNFASASLIHQFLSLIRRIIQNYLHTKWLRMAYKRHRLGPGSSSPPPASSRPQTFSRLSSVPRSLQASSPALPALSQRTEVSPRPQSSQLSVNSALRDENVVRAEIIESDAEIQLREDADAMNEIIMAVDLRDRGTIGCAYYVAREEKLYLMEDIKMSGLDIIDTLKIHALPTVILISNRSDEKLEEHLSREARGIDRGDEASKQTPFVYCNNY